MKFYKEKKKRRNGRKEEKIHAQKDRCLGIWLLITKFTNLYKHPIKTGNKIKCCTSFNTKIFSALILVLAGSMKSYFKTFLLCLVCTFFIAIYESLFRWRVQKKRKWTMEKKVSETNKIKIFNLAVEGMEKKCEKKKKENGKLQRLKMFSLNKKWNCRVCFKIWW